jgi:hypothetical protein
MGQGVSQPVSPMLEELRRRFATWRRTGRKGQRIPEVLWEAAVVAARELGVNRVSRAMGLDYTRLKRRVAGGGAAQAEASLTTTGLVFVELPLDGVAQRLECVVEFEGVRGRFTIRLAEHNPAEVVALALVCFIPSHARIVQNVG